MSECGRIIHTPNTKYEGIYVNIWVIRASRYAYE